MHNGKYLLGQSGPLEGTRVADMTRLAAGISPPERWTKISPISTRWESQFGPAAFGLAATQRDAGHQPRSWASIPKKCYSCSAARLKITVK